VSEANVFTLDDLFYEFIKIGSVGGLFYGYFFNFFLKKKKNPSFNLLKLLILLDT